MKEAITLIDKYGVKPLLLLAILWLNNRVSTVEARLYDCYEQQIKSHPVSKLPTPKIEKTYAILPNKCKSVKECLS
jgi:hypothetical protein